MKAGTGDDDETGSAGDAGARVRDPEEESDNRGEDARWAVITNT